MKKIKIVLSMLLVLCILIPSTLTAFAKSAGTETTEGATHIQNLIDESDVESKTAPTAAENETPENKVNTELIIEEPQQETITEAVIQFAADIQEQLDIAAEKGLTDWVDSEGYFKDSYYSFKSFKELEELGVQKLIRSLTESEVDAKVAQLKTGISARTVTKYYPVTEGYDTVGYFEVDGLVAYCIEHERVTPGLGSLTGAWSESYNDNLRKVLYYGKYGPDDRGYSYVQTSLASSQANGHHGGNTGIRVLREISALPSPPASFHVWIVSSNGGATQYLSFWTMDSKGWLNLNKTSTNPDLTNNNSCYSLAGAENGGYTDWGKTNYIGSLYTDEWGNTNTIELDASTYYVKEITAPKGFAMDWGGTRGCSKCQRHCNCVCTRHPTK